MFRQITMRQLMIIAFFATLAGCASQKPAMYRDIESSPYLKHTPKDSSGHQSYSFATSTNWKLYNNVMVDPVTIYQGADNQFGDIPESDKTSLANYMHAQFVEKLSTRLQMTNIPGPHTLRITLTLTGVTKTTPVLGPLSRFNLMGGLYNGVQSIRGGEGTFTGSVFYAVEIHEAATSQLLSAFIVKQYPNPLNIGASFGALAAARTGIEKGAEELIEQFR